MLDLGGGWAVCWKFLALCKVGFVCRLCIKGIMATRIHKRRGMRASKPIHSACFPGNKKKSL